MGTVSLLRLAGLILLSMGVFIAVRYWLRFTDKRTSPDPEGRRKGHLVLLKSRNRKRVS